MTTVLLFASATISDGDFVLAQDSSMTRIASLMRGAVAHVSTCDEAPVE